MLTYAPGDTLAHRLDPRSKLLFQAGLAVAAMASGSVAWLAGVYALAGLAALGSRLSPVAVARSYRWVLAVLAGAPLLAGVALGPPWVRPDPALASLFAVARVPPVLVVAGAYVRTTPVRDTRAAVERLLPGRPGRVLALGVALVSRFFPLLVRDLRAVRTAVRSRAGERRQVRVRARILAVRGLDRAMARADRLSLALRARCLAWNPTLPALSFGPPDYFVAALGLALACAPLVRASLGHAAW